MAKKIQTTIKLQLPAGKATPAPPVGTALGPHGLNIMDFCKQFNAKTAKEPDGMIFPVLVTVYTDRTFTFILKTPPASILLLRAAGIVKGSAGTEPHQSRQSHQETSGRNRQDQDGGFEHYQHRFGGSYGDGHGAQHGHWTSSKHSDCGIGKRRGCGNGEKSRKEYRECAQESGSAPVQARRSGGAS